MSKNFEQLFFPRFFDFLSKKVTFSKTIRVRSVPKPLKLPSLARSVPKPLLIELRDPGGHQPGRYEPLLIVKWNDEMMKWNEMMKWWWWSKFWVFDFYENFICYRGVLNLKIWWSWGSGIFFFKITAGRTVFNFSCKTSGFYLVFALFK